MDSLPKILHITNWFPEEESPENALWIKRQIETIGPYTRNRILHIEVKEGADKWRWKNSNNFGAEHFLLYTPIKIWFLVELLTSFLLIFVLLFRVKKKNFDLINFHIAYPLCTYWHFLKKFWRKPYLLSEHWSAYHFDFNVKRPKKLKRIKRIFQRNRMPVLTVSEALKQDIERFAETSVKGFVVPNVVRISRGATEGKDSSPYRFFMLSQWKYPKNPILPIEAFHEVFGSENDSVGIMRIGGYGPLKEEIEHTIHRLPFPPEMKFIGALNEEQVERELAKADVFIHCSEYETFSVVCAEALCMGVPVIASAKGGIVEFIEQKNGILVETNGHEEWKESIEQYLNRKEEFSRNREKIAKEAQERFGPKNVGKAYINAIEYTLKNYER